MTLHKLKPLLRSLTDADIANILNKLEVDIKPSDDLEEYIIGALGTADMLVGTGVLPISELLLLIGGIAPYIKRFNEWDQFHIVLLDPWSKYARAVCTGCNDFIRLREELPYKLEVFPIVSVAVDFKAMIAGVKRASGEQRRTQDKADPWSLSGYGQ